MMIVRIGILFKFGNILFMLFIDCNKVVEIIVVRFIWWLVDKLVFWVIIKFVIFNVIIMCIEDWVRILLRLCKFRNEGFWIIIIVSRINSIV